MAGYSRFISWHQSYIRRRSNRERQRKLDRTLIDSFLTLYLLGGIDVGIIQGLPGSKPERVYISGFNVERTTIPALKNEVREMILEADVTMSEPLKELLFKIYSGLQEV